MANSILSRCLSSGDSQSSCEGRAIRGANAAVGTPELSTQTRRLTVHTAMTVQPTRLTVNNREYLVAPAVLVVAGVLNGGLLEEALLIPEDWDHVPVVVNHPVGSDGQPTSARNPAVLAQCGVGHVFHTQRSTGTRQGHPVASLQAELWLDLAQVQACGGEALQAQAMIETQQPMDVSTAFYSESFPGRGTFYGTPYQEVFQAIRPDHLALLPNAVGACDWGAGCGVPRLNALCTNCDATQPCAACAAERSAMAVPPTPTRWQAFMTLLRQFVHDEPLLPLEESPASDPTPSGPVSRAPHLPVEQTPPGPDVPLRQIAHLTLQERLAVQQTDTDVREALYSALAREMETDYTPIFIDSMDLTSQTFVYRQGERLVQRAWTVDAQGILILDPMTTDVQRDTRFVPVAGSEDEAEDEVDSNGDLPQAMAAFVAANANRCPECHGFMAMSTDVNGTVPPCPNCGYQPSTPTTMQRQKEYRPMTTPVASPVASPVAIRARVNNLIANKQFNWTERDRFMLENCTEAFLIRLENQPILVAPPEPPPAPEPPKTAEDAIAGMPVHLQDMFTQMYRDHQGRRQAALAVLIANTGCPFSQEELQEMSVERLEKLVAMGAGVEYSGRGLPAPRPVPVEHEAPPPPPNTMEKVLERQKELGLR